MPRRWIDVAGTGLVSVKLHPLRSAVCLFAVVVVLTPLLAGVAITQGIYREAAASLRFGADLFVTATQFGRTVPVSLDVVPQLEKLDGVLRVEPRIVGEVPLGKNRVKAMLVGTRTPSLRDWGIADEEGPVIAPGQLQFVIGSGIASELGLSVGDMIPPFYRNDRIGERVSIVVGVFPADAPLWQTNLLWTTFETAADVFDQQNAATEILIWTRPGYADAVRDAVLQLKPIHTGPSENPAFFRAVARDDVSRLVERRILLREGLFSLHLLLGLIVGILVLILTSGLGLADRRREIGILKSIGWQTDDLLFRGAVESGFLAICGAAVALILAWIWLRVGNGLGLAAILLPGAHVAPQFRVPYEFTWFAWLLALVISLAVVALGTLFSIWRAAVTSPRECLRG